MWLKYGANPLLDLDSIDQSWFPPDLKIKFDHACILHGEDKHKIRAHLCEAFKKFEREDQDFIKLAVSIGFYRNKFDVLDMIFNLMYKTGKTEYTEYLEDENFKEYNRSALETLLYDITGKNYIADEKTLSFFARELYTINPESLPNKRIAYFTQLYFGEKLQKNMLEQRGCDACFSWK